MRSNSDNMTGMTGILIIRLTIAVRKNLIFKVAWGRAGKGVFQVHALSMLQKAGNVFLLHL